MGRRVLNEYLERLQKEGLVKASNLSEQGSVEIRTVTYDSRVACKGSLFLCKGQNFREEYLKMAMSRGAVCYVSETLFEQEDFPFILVKDIRKAQALLGAFHYGGPQKQLCLTGITGTKGKTTTAYYLKAILDEWEKRPDSDKRGTCGLLSTIHTWDGKEDRPSSMTTPEALELYRHFRNAADGGMHHMVMEVSSQALKYQRVRGLSYEVGVFLNISEDHISPQEHEDFEDYFTSKLSMFRQVKTACVNLDCDHARRILGAAGMCRRIITFGTKGTPDIYGYRMKKEKEGISFYVKTPDFETKICLAMPGMFNVENALAAIAAAYAYGVPAGVIKRALAGVKVNGRMEQYTTGDGKITVIVDFAHNRLSFEKLYDAVLREFRGYAIYSVFGCPGGKGLNRRRELGLISGLFSRKVFLTADDPGMEDSREIAAEIGQYVEITGCPHTYIENRARAIRIAVAQAAARNEKTVLLVLGKGHETSQKFSRRVYDYPSDAVLVREILGDYDARRKNVVRERRKIDELPGKVYNKAKTLCTGVQMGGMYENNTGVGISAKA